MKSSCVLGRTCGAATDQSLNFGTVGGVSDEKREVGSHFSLGQAEDTVKLFPELLLQGLSAVVVELDCVKSHSLKDFHGGLVTLIGLKVVKLSSSGHDVDVKSWGSGHSNPSAESVSISFRNLFLVNQLCES